MRKVVSNGRSLEEVFSNYTSDIYTLRDSIVIDVDVPSTLGRALTAMQWTDQSYVFTVKSPRRTLAISASVSRDENGKFTLQNIEEIPETDLPRVTIQFNL